MAMLFSTDDSYYSLLVNQVYKSLMTREWCSHASELAKFNGVDEDRVRAVGKKSMIGYGELKKTATDCSTVVRYSSVTMPYDKVANTFVKDYLASLSKLSGTTIPHHPVP